MKSRPVSDARRSSLSHLLKKKSTNMLHQKLSGKRTQIKLSPSTEKCVANRTRDKSLRTSEGSPPDQHCSFSPASARSVVAGSPASAKPQASNQRQAMINFPDNRKQVTPKKQTSAKGGAKTSEKGNNKKKVLKQSSPGSLIDQPTLGKREASLNASMKVNIMFERQYPGKSAKTSTSCKHLSQNENVKTKCSPVEGFSLIKPSLKSCNDSINVCCSSDSKCDKLPLPCMVTAKLVSRMPVCRSQTADGSSRKRKSPGYKIFKEASLAKTCMDAKKMLKKSAKKIEKRVKKSVPSGHQLCNIIEKCPRQASLVARAMIAMEQEEDISHELSSRTKFYNWMEMRSLSQAESRRIQWHSGLGMTSDSLYDACSGQVDVVSESHQPTASEGDTLLKTLHQAGDSRLVNEYFRAQKEDFQGNIDVEKCTTPEQSTTSQKCCTPEKYTTPKKCCTPENQHFPPDLVIKTVALQTDKETEKTVTPSPVKLQPCHVVTTGSQMTIGQRSASINNSFIHHPIPQTVYPQHQGQAVPQSFKVTFPSSPAYIYQYAIDRPPQGALYVPPSLSPVPYGIGSSEAAHRDYTSTLTLGRMDSLTLSRRGVGSFQSSPYNTSVHLPMQPIGFNYSAYYPATMQALPQQNMPAIPIHQQYPIMQTQVIGQHQIASDMVPLEAYQHEYPGLQLPAPPPAHRAARMMAPAIGPLAHHSVQPVTAMESLLSVTSGGLQPIARPAAVEYSPNFLHCQGKSLQQFAAVPACRPHHQLTKEQGSMSPFKYAITRHGPGKAFSPCKNQHNEATFNGCDFINTTCMCGSECPPRCLGSCRSSCEGSDVSDLLHSAHTTMYPVDGDGDLSQAHTSICDSPLTSSSPSKINILGHSSFNVSYSVSSMLDKPPCHFKTEPEDKVCTISQMPKVFSSLDHKTGDYPKSASLCFDSAGARTGSDSKETNNSPSHSVPKEPTQDMSDGSSNQCVKQEDNSESVIVLEDTDESGDDEPLARLFKTKLSDAQRKQAHDCNKIINGPSKAQLTTSYIPKQQQKVRANQNKLKDQILEQKKQNKLKDQILEPKKQNNLKDQILEPKKQNKLKDKIPEPKKQNKLKDKILEPKKQNKLKDKIKEQKKQNKLKDKILEPKKQNKLKGKILEQSKPVFFKVKKLASSKLQSAGSSSKPVVDIKSPVVPKPVDDIKSPVVPKPVDDIKSPVIHSASSGILTRFPNPVADAQNRLLVKEAAKNKLVPKTPALGNNPRSKKQATKMKAQPVWPATVTFCGNHGWSWVGEGHMRPVPKVTQSREESARVRRCYQTMRHCSGETVSVRDCVILQSDGDGTVPFVAKVSALWENLNGEMMFSMLWYYQPEHTATGREPEDGEHELFASKHREENSVACIDDRCFVLMYNEYCRLEAEAARHEQCVPLPRWRELLPAVSEEDKRMCRPLPPANTCTDNIWFCRYDYDIRKKIVKKPKHKKSNLRYRVPEKLSDSARPQRF